MKTFAAVSVLAAANLLNNRVAPRLAPLTSVAATAALLHLARDCDRAEIGFHTPARGAVIGGALAAAVLAGYAGGVALPHTRPLLHDERALSLSRVRLAEEALVQVPLGTVLLEEVAFRGVLPALLARSLGPRTAVATSAAMFGLWHVLPAFDMARANPALSGAGGRTGSTRLVVGTVAGTAAAGLLFHELRRRGGLLAPALLHVATNSLGFVAARAARRLTRRQERRNSQSG
ncbi:CPBP family intramembrane metalloprotease [Streptosporangiaceae bacterium NEAU-GS5]|nr:CPBP family intramembrane metalloprotease [Streptosporangiaceae bacterium NEAU-GS5]